VAGIYLTDVPRLHYDTDLFQERVLRSVTANTRGDGDELFRLADGVDLHVATQPYPFEAADVALRDLAADRVTGAAVLVL
jgi:propanol-preferring alcohol dehydrogenase